MRHDLRGRRSKSEYRRKQTECCYGCKKRRQATRRYGVVDSVLLFLAMAACIFALRCPKRMARNGLPVWSLIITKKKKYSSELKYLGSTDSKFVHQKAQKYSLFRGLRICAALIYLSLCCCFFRFDKRL